MENGFVNKIDYIEKELLGIKTASGYTSIRSATTTNSLTVTTGLYKITYNAGSDVVLSNVYARYQRYIWIYPRTPSGNTQVVEVNTTRWNNSTQSYETFDNELVVVANVPISSIVRL